MSKVWVLDTGTKGTGAEMVPLEKVLQKPAPEPSPRARRPLPQPEPRPPKAPEPREPRRFKVLDTMTRRVLADGDARHTLDALADVRSLVDVRIYLWQPKARHWRPLSEPEKRVLWRVATER